MANDRKLETDEARKTAQHEEIKRGLRDEVHHEIERRRGIDSADQAKVENVAKELRQKAIGEVATTETELERERTIARVSQVVAYIFGLIYGLIGLEIALELLGARQRSGFKQFLEVYTSPDEAVRSFN